MSTRANKLVLVLGALVHSAWGCGAVFDTQNDGHPLWTIKCQVVRAEGNLAPASMRVALLWGRSPNKGFSVGEDGRMFMGGVARVAQDLPLEAHFPATFTIELLDVPPEDAIHPGEAFYSEWLGLEVAFAELVVYDDLNGNERLDMLSPDAVEAVDAIIGPREEYRFWLFRGETEGLTFQGEKIAPGLHIFLPADFLVDEQGQHRMTYEEWSKDPVLYVTLLNDPAKQRMMCREEIEYLSNIDKSVRCQEPPEDASVICGGSDTYMATYSRCLQERICSSIECEDVRDFCQLSPGEPRPDYWPCN